MSTPAPSDLVRVALLGAGRWGQAILRTLAQLSGVRVTAVASTNPDTRARVPARCRVEPDWRLVVGADDVDAVIVATPAARHAEMAIAALDRGRAVFVEKPMALSLADARRVAEHARGGVLQVDHIDLMNPAWAALKAALPRIGKIVSVRGRFGSVDGRVDVSPLWDWGPHPTALCIDLLGAPAHAECSEDVLLMRFASGVSASIELGNRLSQRSRRLAIEGTLGTLTYDDNAATKVELRNATGVVSIAHDSTPPLAMALERFVSSIRDGAHSTSDADLGVAVVAALVMASLPQADR